MILVILSLHKAVLGGKNYLALRYIILGATIDAQNNAGQTPLHIAIEQDNLAMISLLLRNKANLMIEDNCGLNCIQYAFNCDNRTLNYIKKLASSTDNKVQS